jgi:hypothetical protein
VPRATVARALHCGLALDISPGRNRELDIVVIGNALSAAYAWGLDIEMADERTLGRLGAEIDAADPSFPDNRNNLAHNFYRGVIVLLTGGNNRISAHGQDFIPEVRLLALGGAVMRCLYDLSLSEEAPALVIAMKCN